jgi:hypothetical protein
MNRYYQNRLFADRQTSFSQRSLGKSVYYYSPEFARLAQIFRGRKFSDLEIPPAKAQRRQGYGERTKTLMNDFHPQSPNFAPFASLREILRVSVAALPRWDLRGKLRFPALVAALSRWVLRAE